MFNYKTFITTFLISCFCELAVAKNNTDNATDYSPTPYMFVGAQGGIQTTFGKNYNNAKLITPTTSISFGAFLTPVFGTRLHVNGLWNQGGFAQEGLDFKYNYKYITTNIDVLLNLVNAFGRKAYSPLNVYVITGFGLNTAWDNDDAYAHKDVLPLAYNTTTFSHNVRLGAMIDYNITRKLGLNLEISANSLGDRYNSRDSNHQDWQLTVQVGIAYKFGYKIKAETGTSNLFLF